MPWPISSAPACWRRGSPSSTTRLAGRCSNPGGPTGRSLCSTASCNVPTDSVVRYGSLPGSLFSSASSSVLTTEHIVKVTGLAADTRYFYSVGETAAELAGNDAVHFFVTSRVAGVKLPARIWVIGDAGTNTPDSARCGTLMRLTPGRPRPTCGSCSVTTPT